MIIRDVMPPFELYQPTQLRDAFALLDRFGKDAWKMAGGYDSLSWFKDRIKRPKAVIVMLPMEQRKTLEMAFFDGLTHSEIAEMTGDPLGTVKTRIRSGLTTLRKAFTA